MSRWVRSCRCGRSVFDHRVAACIGRSSLHERINRNESIHARRSPRPFTLRRPRGGAIASCRGGIVGSMESRAPRMRERGPWGPGRVQLRRSGSSGTASMQQRWVTRRHRCVTDRRANRPRPISLRCRLPQARVGDRALGGSGIRRHRRVLDGGDESHAGTAAGAAQGIDLEDSLKQ